MLASAKRLKVDVHYQIIYQPFKTIRSILFDVDSPQSNIFSNL